MRKRNLFVCVIVMIYIFSFQVLATGNNNTYIFSDTSFVIDKNGDLWGFGENLYGQVIKNDENYIDAPVQIFEDVMSIYNTSTKTYALKYDGTLWQWGQGFSEPLQIMNEISSLNGKYITYFNGTVSDINSLNEGLITFVNDMLLFNGEVFARNIKQYEICKNNIYILGNDNTVSIYNFTEEGAVFSSNVMNNIVEISCYDDTYFMLSNSDSLYFLETSELVYENVLKYSKHYALDNSGNLYSILNERIILEKIIDFSEIETGICYIIEDKNTLWYQAHFFDIDEFGNKFVAGIGNISTKISDDILTVFNNGYYLHIDNNLWNIGQEITSFIEADYATSYYSTIFSPTRIAVPALNMNTSVFENILNDDSNDNAKNLANAVIAEYGAEVLAVYELGNSIHYVIYDDNDGVKGGTVITITQNEETAYVFGEFSTDLASQKDLISIASDHIMTSSISIDILPTSDLETLCTYLMNLLESIDINNINDATKSEIANFIEGAISQQSAIAVLALDNSTRITNNQIQVALEVAQETKDRLEAIVVDSGIELNKAIEICILVVFGDVTLETPLQITLDNSLLNLLNGASAQLLLEDGSHGISFTSQNLDSILSTYYEVTVQLQKEDEGIYACYFLDKDGNVIDQLSASLGIILPANHELYTVIANLSDGDVNWGGQFNSANNSIIFRTPYSSKYIVFDNSVSINDIDDLHLNIIAFMVSKGFFNVDENGNFYPNDNLTRYDFTQTIVSMFFSLETDLDTTFVDVPANSDYYDYIASAQKSFIVEGFSADVFAGDLAITTEQVLTLVARTLVEQKNYLYDTSETDYLAMVSGSEKGSSWAIQQIELAIREGIVYPYETINPNSDIRREDAAIYLYRLFMLLEKVNETSFDLRAEYIQVINEDGNVVTSSTDSVFVVYIAIIGAVLGGITAYFVKKKSVSEANKEIENLEDNSNDNEENLEDKSNENIEDNLK